ncbi:bifunctional adenosylcobinamide kinase/adenosylcobinamide-phosphate guanylyltransferase [Paracoccus shanxieyensis]|uniref:Bifunctional adenosylcobalamin biosynthesis protein n=1 Tax=Paracoccus shanxieyensis TaxID=2675752 RepID=A0A6L6IVD9_9RHOB|nr:bifunctional adenosylcobinamide kinase/adenosylcobinamide-phosphate guanylyltransferase [Paracoccus shanxieyensis]MTH63581.1 bifunctional adenosylcobinamide kinase/adenosylcobinamide-phosphate guanylyltransferase [Paracoccus shanxieyensis]MTH86502.1 bifunctional adenosylcobinamide kinase/adenosylcobinamide-phosphate guanylyltransferase [Paracoccus shanxieyensis]
MNSEPRIVMVTGGARSGKSSLAESILCRHAGPRIYVATAQAWDDEMTQRIKLHRDRRDADWTTVEEPLDLPGVLQRTDGQGARLVDCLTLWLANLGEAPGPAIDALCAVLERQQSPVVLVTNELGQGIVPENALARRFRDQHGLMNQAVARIADEVWMAVSGLPLRLKPQKETA